MHWTQTPEGKKRMNEIAAQGRAKLAQMQSGKKRSGSPKGRVVSAEARRKMSEAMAASWARRKGHRGPGRPRKDVIVPKVEHGIVGHVTTLAHSLTDAQLNGGLTTAEVHSLQQLTKLIDLHV